MKRGALTTLLTLAAAYGAEVDSLKEKAEAAIRAGDGPRALALLEQAYAADPQPGLVANQGVVYERLGQIERAVAAFERYLTLDPPGPKRLAAEATLRRLKPEVVLVSAPDSATVWIDGRAVGRTPLTLRLPAGRHAARLEARGHAPLVPRFEVPMGEPTRLSYTLVPLPEAPVPDATVGWTVMGGGAAAVVTAGVFGWMTADAVRARDEATSLHDFGARQDDANAYLVGTLVSAGVGLAAMGVATWMLMETP